jgi:hypothetical protein
MNSADTFSLALHRHALTPAQVPNPEGLGPAVDQPILGQAPRYAHA